ncbi:MAG TPA: hypothetical protein VMV86_03865 [Methanosarcinales archaeon]|nr:hypothetical protein [Methanosarcinales archaeon]
MAIDVNQVVAYMLPIIGGFVYSIVGIAACIGVWYYLFVIKQRRFWLVDVYEQKSDGKLYLVQKDRLQEKKINKGKQTIYVFRKTKTEAIPPPYECTRRLGNKEYCDYVRILGEYVPLVATEQKLPDFSKPAIKSKLFRVMLQRLRDIRSIPTTRKKADSVENKYVYVPLYKALKYDIDFKPISYDVNMMRINEIDNIDAMFKNKEGFMQKYGAFIGVGVAAVVLIVVCYLSFEYMQQVISQTLGAADKVANPLNALVDKIGGSPPPS